MTLHARRNPLYTVKQQEENHIMNGSNKDARNSIHRSQLRETYLLIAGLLAAFWLFIVLALGVFSGAQATYAKPPPDPALTGHFGRMFHLPPLSTHGKFSFGRLTQFCVTISGEDVFGG